MKSLAFLLAGLAAPFAQAAAPDALSADELKAKVVEVTDAQNKVGTKRPNKGARGEWHLLKHRHSRAGGNRSSTAEGWSSSAFEAPKALGSRLRGNDETREIALK